MMTVNLRNRHNWLVDRERVRQGDLKPEELVPPYCDACLDEIPQQWDPNMEQFTQTTYHLFAECEAVATARLQTFGQAFGMPLHKIKRKDILKFIHKAKAKVLPTDNSEVMAIDRSNIIENAEELNEINED